MAKNDFIRKRNERDQAFFDAGERIGMQKMWDYVQLSLRDQEVVGKDTFGKERLRKLFYRIKKRVDYYHTAFTDDVEADFRQAQMDRELEEIWGDELSPFYERYSELKRTRYDKPKKGWVDV